MLLRLEIHNVALIDEVNIELGSGLNILTGETGAGKSIIIDSINAVLGGRVSRDIIRTGSEKALVEAVFQVEPGQVDDILAEMGMEPEEDGTLILSREISLTGKNTCRINGKMVAVSYLKAVGERLVDIHGQHDNQSLLRTESHVELLDSFGGATIQTLKAEYMEQLEEFRETRAKIKEMSGDPGERERKIDLLRYQIDEIRKAKLKNGEEEELNRQKTLLSNAEKISNSISTAYNLVSSGGPGIKSAIDNLNEALAHLSAISRFDEAYDDMQKQLQDVIYQLDDLAGALRQARDTVEYNPDMLEEIEERLDLIYRLKRKYGSTIAEIHEYCTSAERQLSEIEKSEEVLNALSEKQARLEKQMRETCQRLHDERKTAASILESRIGQELDDLEMKNAKFNVNIRFDNLEGDEARFTQNGLDKIEFMISANAGEPLKPLAKIASGGEMSRIMLAIKTILAEVDRIPTLIFDEIDIGISGKAAHKVGEKLAYISGAHQVVCVTHLPQIACMADHHFLIEKITENNSTKTKVTKLDGNRRIEEIARLIGGAGTTATSLKYAEELIKNAKKSKKALKY